MPLEKQYNKMMGVIRKEYPSYSLKRRKRIVGALVYGREKKRK